MYRNARGGGCRTCGLGAYAQSEDGEWWEWDPAPIPELPDDPPPVELGLEYTVEPQPDPGFGVLPWILGFVVTASIFQ